MSNKLILSILVPTRNRVEYAVYLVKQVLDFQSIDFELIIQDNSDQPLLEDLLNEYLTDSRLLYIYEPTPLSFVDNFSSGISRCKGEYVIIIGDDDGVNFDIIQLVKWASLNNIDAISPSLPIIYFWPSSEIQNNYENGGELIMNKFTGRIQSYNTSIEVSRFLKNGCNNYLNYNLAKIYHGIVKKSVLEQIKQTTGFYVGGLTPDIYLSIAISLSIDKVYFIDYPITISGICNKSGSSDSVTGKHTGYLSQAPHFKGHSNYLWHNLIPRFYSVETIWAESSLKAIIDLNRKLLLKQFNENLLIIRCLFKYPKFNFIILKHFCKKNIKYNRFHIMLQFLIFRLISLCQFLVNYFKRIQNKLKPGFKNRRFQNIKNVLEANSLISEIFQKENIEINNFLKKYRI